MLVNEEENPVPVGTWTSQDENTGDGDGVVHLPDAPRQPSVADRSNSQVGPLPTSPLALAREPTTQHRPDETGMRPRQEARVVPLRPEAPSKEVSAEPDASSALAAPSQPATLEVVSEATLDVVPRPGPASVVMEIPDSEPPSDLESEIGLEPEPELAAELAAVLEPEAPVGSEMAVASVAEAAPEDAPSAAAEAEPNPGPSEPEPSEPEPTQELLDAAAPPKVKAATVEPPILASKILREDLFPAEPFARGGRLGLAGLGAATALAAVGVGGFASASLVTAVCGLVVLAAAIVPLSYARRAAISLTATFLAASPFILDRLNTGQLEDVVLGAGSMVLGAGLMLRGWYRSSRLARVVVAIGVVAIASWFVVSGGLVSLTSLESGWQSWAPTIVHILIVLVALLSLLAFMDASTTSGATFWATSALVLFAAHSGLSVLAAFFPLEDWTAGATYPAAALGAQAGGCVATVAGTIALGLLLATANHRATTSTP